MNVAPPFYLPHLGNNKVKGWSADQPSAQPFTLSLALEFGVEGPNP